VLHDVPQNYMRLTWDSSSINEYADVRSNKTLSRLYAEAMTNLSSPVDCDFEKPTEIAGSTDQGKRIAPYFTLCTKSALQEM
jgi:hypothetical protein